MDGRICKWGDDSHCYEWTDGRDGRRLKRVARPKGAYEGAPGTDFRCRCVAIPYVPEYEDGYERERTKGPVRGVVQGEHAELPRNSKARRAETKRIATEKENHALRNKIENMREASMALEKENSKGIKNAIRMVKNDVAENYSIPGKALPVNVLNDFRKEFLKIAQITGVGKFESVVEHVAIGETVAFQEPNIFRINVPLFKDAFEKQKFFFNENVVKSRKNEGIRFLAIENEKNVRKYIVAHELGHKIFYDSKFEGKYEKLKALCKKVMQDGSIGEVSGYAKISVTEKDYEEFFAEIFAMWIQNSLSLKKECVQFIKEILE